MEFTTESTGRTVGRLIKAIAAGRGNDDAAAAYASSQGWWLEEGSLRTAILSKAAVGAISAAQLPSGPVRNDFLAALRPRSILSRLTGATSVPLRTRVIAFGSGSSGYEVGEGQPIPVITSQSAAGVIVAPRRFAAVSIVSDELLEFAAPGAEEALAADLAAAVGMVEDAAAIAALDGRSLVGSATLIASAGTSVANVDTDLQAALGALPTGTDFTKLAWVLSPLAATRLASLRGSGGARAFPDISPAGGMLLGSMVITSEAAAGRLILLDQSGVLIGGPAGVDIALSNATALQLSDAPTVNSLIPTAAAMTSTFQTNTTAIRAAIYRGWYARAGAAVVVTGGTF